MKTFLRSFALFVGAFLFLQGNLSAQIQVVPINSLDSTALVELYNKSGGPNWVNPWDLTQPISTWSGVILSQNGQRVVELRLSQRNLSDSIPAAFNLLGALITADFSGNQIEDLPFMRGMQAMRDFNVSSNKLTFDDIDGPLDEFLRNQVDLNYSNQDSVGFRKIVPAYEGGSLTLRSRVDVRTSNSNTFLWYKSQVGTQVLNRSREYVLKVDSTTDGTFYYTITNNGYTQLTLIGRAQVVNYYNFPNPFGRRKLSFILTLTDADRQNPAYLQEIRDSLIAAGGAIVDSCFCGTYMVWDFDSIKTPGGIIIDPNSSGSGGLSIIPPRQGGDPSDKPDFDPNYSMIFGDSDIPNTKWAIDASAIQGIPQISSPQKTPVVAVIDLGVEASHPALEGRIYEDPSATATGLDECYTNDPNGINFQNPAVPPFNDITGHGTHVASTIVSVLPGLSTQIMSIQVGDDPSSATVFNVVCGIEYALRHDVDVINISMGYQGPKVPLLERIMTSEEAKKALFVTAAGNESANNNNIEHWPSNFAGQPGNFHIQSVASFGKDAMNQYQISQTSNFGDLTVNVAAPGENIFAAVNNGGYDFKSGTSMSVAFVSAVGAALKATNPSLKGSEVAEIIYATNLTVTESNFAGKVAGERRLNVDIINCLTNPQANADSAKVDWFEFGKDIPVYLNDCLGNKNIAPTIIVDADFGSASWDATKLAYVYTPNFISLVMGAQDSFTYQYCPDPNNQNNCTEAIVTVQKTGVGIWGVVILVLLLLLLIVRRMRNNNTSSPRP